MKYIKHPVCDRQLLIYSPHSRSGVQALLCCRLRCLSFIATGCIRSRLAWSNLQAIGDAFCVRGTAILNGEPSLFCCFLLGLISYSPSSPPFKVNEGLTERISMDYEERTSAILTCIHPHSIILLSNHFSDTGFVKKSLHPAAKASTRSCIKLEAVKATMITDERMGLPGAISMAGLSVWRDSEFGVDGKRPTLFDLSISRIAFVASRPFMTGNWISICRRTG
jgi:hypothetical protein